MPSALPAAADFALPGLRALLCRTAAWAGLMALALAFTGCASLPVDEDVVIGRSRIITTPDGQWRRVAVSGRGGEQRTPQERNWWWEGDGVSGSPRITISISEQKARFYKGGKLVGETEVSTGREGYGTQPGSYSIIQKSPDHRSSIYGAYVDYGGNTVVSNVNSRTDYRPAGTRYVGASMPYFLRFYGGVGMHAGYLPGYPASHGCVRLPYEAARIFYENAPYGTPVRVTY